MFEYGMRVVRVVDGDTLIGVIDLGLHVYISRSVRMLFYNAPELTMAHAKTKDETGLGLLCKEKLSKMLPPGTVVVIRTELDHDDKYGRVLGELWTEDANGNRSSINLAMKKLADECWEKLHDAHPAVYGVAAKMSDGT